MEIQNRWKEYCEGFLIVENPSDSFPTAAPVYDPEPQVTMGEIMTAIKNMKPRNSRRTISNHCRCYQDDG